MAKVKPLLKILASIWIVYNICAIMVMPNVSSYFGRVASKFFGPYANQVGLNAGWNFFSPDPAHPMYLKVVVNYPMAQNGAYREPLITAFPFAESEKTMPSLSRKREWAVMRYMVMDPRRLRQVFGPWLCKQFPEAESIDMEHVIETLPLLDEAVSKSEVNLLDMSQERRAAKASVRCNSPGDEELL
ncbi:hypothetical protein [Bdellovibrio sp. KM01]|uniref:hypothetical protein n=1 Tax=Bdellovibrio sp. KM01 TaxID=2748865 RepID=UPI0021040359|nr:hypothetical protein [Bdellovibrio sp. KM01]